MLERAHVLCLSGRLDTSGLNLDAGAKMQGVKQGPKQVNGARSVNNLLPSQRAAAHATSGVTVHAYGKQAEYLLCRLLSNRKYVSPTCIYLCPMLNLQLGANGKVLFLAVHRPSKNCK